jgi:hypothetical protein
MVLPLAAAVWVLTARWGEDNFAFILIVPVFLLFWKMFTTSQERPLCPELADHKPFNGAIQRWHIYEVLGLVFLMCFEGLTAALAQNRNEADLPVVTLLTFVPYAVLAWRARCNLMHANSLVAQLTEMPGMSDL